MNNTDRLFTTLENAGIEITNETKTKIRDKIVKTLSYEPRIGIFGKTGVGKSSLCNALFGENIATISNVEACTRNPQEILLGIGGKGIKLIDVPGVGENKNRDIEYGELYSKLLPEIDVVFWVLKGDDRAFSTDQLFYESVVKPHIDQNKPFFIIVNQVDKIEPYREWIIEKRIPGAEQKINIEKKLDNVAEVFKYPRSKIIDISTSEKYNLVRLIDEIIFALPNDKKITVLKEVKEENISKESKNNAIEAWYEELGDIVEVFIPGSKKVVNAIGKTIDFVKDVVTDVLGGIKDFFTGWW